MKIREKKGEITTTQIVILIVLILSFIIILFLIFRLNLGATTNEEICHNSVILKGQANLNTVSLDCKTNYVCISGGENCEKISETARYEFFSIDKIQVMNALAEEMANCWWMFGQGEVEYEKGFFENSKQCAICSIVDFDSKARDKIKEISYAEFISYLKETKKEENGGESYYSYLYGNSEIENVPGFDIFGADINGNILLSERQSILTGVNMNVFGKDRYLNVFLITTSKTSETECEGFLTKA